MPTFSDAILVYLRDPLPVGDERPAARSCCGCAAPTGSARSGTPSGGCRAPLAGPTRPPTWRSPAAELCEVRPGGALAEVLRGRTARLRATRPPPAPRCPNCSATDRDRADRPAGDPRPAARPPPGHRRRRLPAPPGAARRSSRTTCWSPPSSPRTPRSASTRRCCTAARRTSPTSCSARCCPTRCRSPPASGSPAAICRPPRPPGSAATGTTRSRCPAAGSRWSSATSWATP